MSRKKKFIELVRHSAAHNRKVDEGQIIVPGGRTSRKWPLCMTCGREVDAVAIKNVNTKSCELWARCHGGAEDYYTVEFPFRFDDGPGDILDDPEVNACIVAAQHSAVMFDPTRILK